MARPSYLFIDGLHDRINTEIYNQNRTKKDIAKQCGFDRRVLSNDTGISIVYFARICSALHISADYLLFGKE